jgi:D-alanyl-D-alanine endopeptidase (penicillin-binding protein 7)
LSAYSQDYSDYQSPILSAHAAMVYDEREQRILFSKNAETVVPIASITKLMTAIVVLEAQLPLNEKIRICSKDKDNSQRTHSRMRPGMSLTRGELLKLALMSSENRAAAALARTYPGGLKVAIAKMNLKARELGMKDTRFLDPTGLNRGNVSTARDLVKLVLAAQKYEPIHRATTTSFHTLEQRGFRPLLFTNTNPLVRNSSWSIDVSKTGFISEAGRCLVMKANIRQRPVVIVILDSGTKASRVGDANRLKEWMESV